MKQKIQSLQQYSSHSRNRLIWKPVLQKSTSSRCVLFVRRISKHDHIIYGAAKVQISIKNKLTYLSTNFNFAPSPTARKPKLRHMKECLSVHHDIFHYLTYFFFSTTYLSFSEKSRTKGIADFPDQGPRINSSSIVGDEVRVSLNGGFKPNALS